MSERAIEFCPLISGSSGNATFVGCGRTGILVDCGQSGKTIQHCLDEIGVEMERISAILITHAHNDHVRGAGILSRRFDLPIYASIGTWEALMNGKMIGDIPARHVKVFQSQSGTKLDFGELEVQCFSIPHDAPDPVGFRFDNGETSVAIATDIGHVSESVRHNLTGAAVILLESNHDVEMLRKGPYTEFLKRRILSNYGHLSNDNAGLFAGELLRTGTERIYLGHLSHENNTPELARSTVVQLLHKAQITFQEKTQILLASRENVSSLTVVDRGGCRELS